MGRYGFVLEFDDRFNCEAEGDMGGEAAGLDPVLVSTRCVAE